MLEDRSVDALVAWCWREPLAAAFAAEASEGAAPGRVLAAASGLYTAVTPRGETAAVAAGRLRHRTDSAADLPVVGDWVSVRPAADAAGTAVIEAVLPRRSVFRRGAGRLIDEQVLAANVDVAFLVSGLDGDLNLRRIERYLALTWSCGVSPVIVLNKADVSADVMGRRLAVEAVAPTVPVVVTSALERTGLHDLAPYLATGATAVVLGSSGVGKSTLVNALLGEPRQATAAVRADDARGRHTTTARELIRLPGGTLLIDTPGLRSVDVAGAEDGLTQAFADIEAIAVDCRFSDCGHAHEPGCAVRPAIEDGRLDASRLASLRKLEREAAYAASRNDPIARAAERRRWRAIHAAVNRHMRFKYGDEGR